MPDPRISLRNRLVVRSGFGLVVLALCFVAACSGATDGSDPTDALAAQTVITLWPNTTVPASPSDADTSSVELGVKFKASVAGQVTALRFYKGAQNTGSHVGTLWSSTGQVLARVTFANETKSGWQTATLAKPVALRPGTVYVASYHAPHGRYAGDDRYFQKSGHTSGPLYALADGEAGGNGVYHYGSTTAFPDGTWNGSNYYVDVDFAPGGEGSAGGGGSSGGGGSAGGGASGGGASGGGSAGGGASGGSGGLAGGGSAGNAGSAGGGAGGHAGFAGEAGSAGSAGGTAQPCPPGWPVCPAVVGKPPTGTKCEASPHDCGFADETTTGILAGVILTKVPSQATSGPGWACVPSASNCQGISVTGNVGTATTGLELADGLSVDVPDGTSNITLRNLRLDGIHGVNADGITIQAKTSGITVDHCDITGAPDNAGPYSAKRGWNAIHIRSGASSYAVTSCHIRGFAGGVFPEREAGVDRLVGNYIHHMMCWDYDKNIPCDAAGSSPSTHDHCNAIGTGGGPKDLTSSLLIQNNTMWGDNPVCESDEVALFPDGAPQTNQHTLIYHNLMSGAGYCVNPGYEDAYGSYGRSYVGMMYNHWSTRYGDNCGSYGVSYLTLDAASGAGNFQCGNVWDDGAHPGSGADQSNEYASSSQPVTACPF